MKKQQTKRLVIAKERKLYFIKPKTDAQADANQIAQQLLELNCVEEVQITSGDIGFAVKANFPKGEEPKELSKYLKSSCGSCMKADSHYTYRKAAMKAR